MTPGVSLVTEVPAALVRRVGQRLDATAVRQIRATREKDRSANAWFRAEVASGPAFVKCYPRPDRAQAERAVARALPPGMAVPFLGGGALGGPGDYPEYNCFAWRDLGPVRADPYGLRAAGERLGALHAVTPPAGLVPREVGPAAYDALLARLQEVSPYLDDRLRFRLDGDWARAVVTAAGSAARKASVVLLHGDFSLRNIGTAANGTTLLFDFERAETGPPELDLERIWDREATASGGHPALLAGYRAGGGAAEPDPVLLTYARLCCAVSTLVAAGRTGDTEFAREAHVILDRLPWRGEPAW
ncbi:phosphotransferase [Salinispora sp. H7-4]|uniref:phosphotransferase n=1 Tax=Salinispora sp. H7-4 TaxID=2748321 RepID=UPI0015D38298|nr:phosphotransferase [Salinispora sp. H7-4]NYT92305.1 phosphotransferase [Salinispora sp. H7-4]